jgi:hypothetical protein
MICPFCQHELVVEHDVCPNCAAVFPHRTGAPFGVKVRNLLLGGAMLFLSAFILQECVLTNIQSNYVVAACSLHSTGGNCEVSTRQAWLSPQGSQFGPPDVKSPELQQLILLWQNNEQPTQNNPFALPKKSPSR